MEQRKLIKSLSDVQKHIEIAIKLLHTIDVIITEITKFLTELNFDNGH